MKIGRRTLAVSNLDKVLYPGAGFTKAQVLDYYRRVAPLLLPHFRGRPVTLVRFPEGVFGEAFYEKDAPGYAPPWIKTFPVPRGEGGVIHYILINDVPTLMWVANLAALELHPFLHRVPRLEVPTHIVFDLDPGEGVDLLACGKVALLVRGVLTRLGLDCFPKVSGSKGIQVYLPLNTPTTYESAGAFARAVAELLAKEHPRSIVSEMAKTLRTGKVFIDWSQNSQTKTTIGPYSLRARSARPLVSMPVAWSELERAMRRRDADLLCFPPEGALSRIERHGDLFGPVLHLRQRLPNEFLPSLSPVSSKRLSAYTSKRDFRRTPEPGPIVVPRRSAQGSRRRFVVQKHAASHLHYDFRLELSDMLKSWAVPKGIPLNNRQQHTAFSTEDHPLE
ncbi:MAG TPA: non-homologous end-joining DNA ligase, partial [Verrucomicrobiae bacterium]|nr:non-homologous end-joining DNA ligase [Verrucomicrobiae bacterium]